MRTRSAALLFVITLVTSTTLHAQTLFDLHDQLLYLSSRLGEETTSQGRVLGASTQCPSLTRNLDRGARGSDVAALQQFLTGTGDYTYGEITSYIGPVTIAAIKKFQCRDMNVCSGTPATTGYGRVGPGTRAAIARVCSTTTAPAHTYETSPETTPVPPSTQTPQPTTSALDTALNEIDALLSSPQDTDTTPTDDDI